MSPTNSASVAVLNVGEVPLSGLTAAVNGLAANLSASAVLSSNSLSGMGAATLSLSVSARDASSRQSSFTVHLSSAQGAMVDLPVAMTVTPLSARLVSGPPQLAAAMVRGGQATFSVARTLGISGQTLHNWVKAEAAGRLREIAGKTVSAEQMEIARLKAELAKARIERDILKKAAAYFARESR